MTRKDLRNILWLGAGVLAVAAVLHNTTYLALASIIWVLGSIQEDIEKEA